MDATMKKFMTHVSLKSTLKKTIASISAGLLVSLTACSHVSQMTNLPTQPLKIAQGAPLPYTVMDNSITDGAKPNRKMEIRNGGFGSDAVAHPTNAIQFYALTDRGPNAKYKGSAGKGKQFMTPDYTPRIGLFELQTDGSIAKVEEILLKDRSGKAISGLPNPAALGGTKEVAYDKHGELILVNPNQAYDKTNNPTRTDIYGLDSEGIAALKDGTFWISDEYGPHIVHYDANGVEIDRINAFSQDDRNTIKINGKTIRLPAEFAKRRANRGMEGLAITSDQTTLVGIMQSSMDNPDKSGRKTDLTRIVTVNLKTGKVAQYLYRQQKAQNSNSGIVAINNHEFYVIERDGKFAKKTPNAQKHIYKIDLSTATNLETVANSDAFTQDDTLGLLFGQQTLEQFIADDASHWNALAMLDVHPAKKVLVADAVKELGYPHDKLEGMWLMADGTLGLLNDDDFASWASKNVLEQKYLNEAKTIIDANRLYFVKPTE